MSKNIYDLLDEKVVIFQRIEKMPKPDVGENRNKEAFANFTSHLGLPENFYKDSQNLSDVGECFDDLQRLKAEYTHNLESLSLYKAAYIEHKKLVASGNYPDAVKKVSENNIRLYEAEMAKQGVTKEMMMGAIIYPDFDKRLKNFYALEIVGRFEELAASHKEFGKVPTVNEAEDNLNLATSKLYKNFAKTLSGDENEVIRTLANNDVNYLKGAKDVLYYPNNFDGESYRFFELKDGEYKEKPYPKGFFNKIGYFFAKLLHKGEEEREISSAMNNAEREIETLPEELKDVTLTADLGLIDPEKELQNKLVEDLGKETSEKFDKYLKAEMEAPINEIDAPKTEMTNEPSFLESVD